MVEANENIDEVTMRRQGDVRSAQASFQRALSEGRLVVRSRQGSPADGRAALVAAGTDGAGGQVATSTTLPAVATSTTLPEVATSTTLPVDPEAAWRYTRLAITAGLVVLLFIVWVWQRRARR